MSLLSCENPKYKKKWLNTFDLWTKKKYSKKYNATTQWPKIEISLRKLFRPNKTYFTLYSTYSIDDNMSVSKKRCCRDRQWRPRYSLIFIRENYNFVMLAMIWHEIVCRFLKKNKFWFFDMQNNLMLPTSKNSQKLMKIQKSTDKHLSFDGLIQEE